MCEMKGVHPKRVIEKFKCAYDVNKLDPPCSKLTLRKTQAL